ncbi:DNA fragmentation factor subunit alpha isoform X2 [Pseudophryne corroboree]|uniref:DNA fragmentation factor subunit alpha isoform X2 n=1 Tax=Pseudophryne corroboree TaxID=495146 RepID=UPI00308135AB
MKRCVVSVRGGKDKHGVAAASLQELSDKAIALLQLDPAQGPSTLVLAEDGTIVEDEDYFLCLPEDTEFVVLMGDKKWASCTVDGGTAWLARESVDLDDIDSGQLPEWKVLAAQLRENLSNIILLSESDFQTLIDVPTVELGREMAVDPIKAEMLKDTLQGLLDRREEERRSTELLQLYVTAVTKDETDGCNVTEPDSIGDADGTEGRKSRLSSNIITVLREKRLPHLSLSNEQLEAVCAQDADALSVDLKWTPENVRKLQTTCAEQLQLRYEQVQCMNSLSSVSQSKRKRVP